MFKIIRIRNSELNLHREYIIPDSQHCFFTRRIRTNKLLSQGLGFEIFINNGRKGKKFSEKNSSNIVWRHCRKFPISWETFVILLPYSGMPERGDMVSLALKFGSYTVHRLRYNTIVGKGTVQFTTTRCCGAALFLGRLLPWQLIFHLAPFHVKRKIIFQPINHFFLFSKIFIWNIRHG